MIRQFFTRTGRVSYASVQSSMKIRFKYILSTALVLLSIALPVFAGHAFGQQNIRLATLDWPPYIGKDLPEEGYTAELIRTAFKRVGYEVKFLFMPWKRALNTVSEGHYEGLAPIYFTKQRAMEFSLSEAFPSGPLVFAKRKNSNIDYTQLRDLRPYKIACVSGYANTKEFDDAAYLQKSLTNNDTTGYRRLLFGTVELWLADKFVAQYTISNHLPERAVEIEFIDKPLGIKNLHVAFSRMKVNHQKLTKDFNKGLSSVLTDGTLESILAKHGLSLE